MTLRQAINEIIENEDKSVQINQCTLIHSIHKVAENALFELEYYLYLYGTIDRMKQTTRGQNVFRRLHTIKGRLILILKTK